MPEQADKPAPLTRQDRIAAIDAKIEEVTHSASVRISRLEAERKEVIRSVDGRDLAGERAASVEATAGRYLELCAAFPPRPIGSQAEYEANLERSREVRDDLSPLIPASHFTAELDYIEALEMFSDDYERRLQEAVAALGGDDDDVPY